MIWGHTSDGYLFSVALPEQGRCRLCGSTYMRKVHDVPSWQAAVPDRCPSCGHVENQVAGVAFENVPA